MTPPPSPPVGGGAPRPQSAPPTGNPLDAFAPTARPGEPITAGIPLGAGPSGPSLGDDPDSWIRAAYAVTGHPALAELLTDMAGEM